MTRFLDVRLQNVGGDLAPSVAINQGVDLASYTSLGKTQLLNDIAGQHVLIATHGYNVDRAAGIASLSNWARQLQLPPQSVFVGLLWPGDSVWGHGLDYPEEPRFANDAGDLLGPFLDDTFSNAATLSFASHSLGARVVMRTLSKVSRRARGAMLMAGAIDDDCLTNEFQAAAARVDAISVLASRGDQVLSTLFPLGNFLGGILTDGHPWFRGALGLTGPAQPRPANFQAPFQIPDNWNYNHCNYLEIDSAPTPVIPLPASVPPNGSPKPAAGAAGWQSAWSAAVCSTRFP
jgi:hypothetical protein